MNRDYWAIGTGMPGFVEEAMRVEDRGYAGLTVGQLYAPPFIQLAAAGARTTRLQLASGIAMGLTRSPFETAMSAIELDRLCEGRFALGLGTGPEHFTTGYFGMPYDKPVSRLREIVQILRQVEDGARSGTMEPYRGKCYQLEFPAYEPGLPPLRERIPVWLAALRGKMCELAGEAADGLLGHPIWSVDWALGEAQQSLAAGAARSGRDPAAIHFQPWVAVSISSDAQQAVDEAKPQVAFYGGFAQYQPYFEAHGYGPEVVKLQEAAKSMTPVEAASLVPDEMARRFVACGTPDQALEWVEPLWARANSMVIHTPYWGLAPERYIEKKAAMEDAFLGR